MAKSKFSFNDRREVFDGLNDILKGMRKLRAVAERNEDETALEMVGELDIAMLARNRQIRRHFELGYDTPR